MRRVIPYSWDSCTRIKLNTAQRFQAKAMSMFYLNFSALLARTGAALIGALAVAASHGASLSSFTAATGIRINGAGVGEETSRGINFIGDINADGRTDIAIGAPLAGSSGKVYVVFGTGTPFSLRDFNPSTLNGSNGFTILGVGAGSGLGRTTKSSLAYAAKSSIARKFSTVQGASPLRKN
jgi:hypothetical protein